jgi:hypothetical protein
MCVLMLTVPDHTYTTIKYSRKKPTKKPEIPLVIFHKLQTNVSAEPAWKCKSDWAAYRKPKRSRKIPAAEERRTVRKVQAER